MKKILCMFSILFLLAGCVTIQQAPRQENETVSKDTTEDVLNSFAINTLSSYGKSVDANLAIKKQGPDKRMALIKEKRSNARPLITKLVYLESTEEILYLMVDNEVIIDN